MNNIDSKNVLALAYLGDAIYEAYVRKYLLDKNIEKVDELQKESINYVSAKNQAKYLLEMIDNDFFTEEEIDIIKRGRNHKSRNPKHVDTGTYHNATGFETLIGYLYLKNDYKRIDEIMNYILK
ncbi:MAG: ribonuclease III [Bacilli bacterium]|nr:ribonuclease III [Bacilli bacterium]